MTTEIQKSAASVHDVAAYILKQRGAMSAMKLQKLVYYSQAWSLVWDDRPLFAEDIEAWADGPVCPAVYQRHRGMFTVTAWGGNPEVIDAAARETIDAVLDYYGSRNAQWLSDLTHEETPWRDARRDLPLGARCSNVISHASMAEYYSSLPPSAVQVS